LSRYKVFISAESIQEKVQELAFEISNDYAGDNPLLITLLKGAFVFVADLVRHLSVPHEIDFVTLSSYRSGMQRNGDVEILTQLKCDLAGRDVIIVDEIVDTGHTLSRLIRDLSEYGVRSLKVCALLDKPSAREVEVPVHYAGFTIPDTFVVGYGLDFDERYRNLPYITELTPELNRSVVPIEIMTRSTKSTK